jgi:octaheme c-type cytochrome (tetrathionate reductase family)
MKNNKYLWILVLGLSVAFVILPLILFLPQDKTEKHDPWTNVPQRPTQTDHTNLITDTLETGQQVTQACLECHPDASSQVMSTAHWTWESKPIEVPGRDGPVTVGKKNQINNFCIGIQGNWQKCVSCHAGYGWEDETFHETATEDQVDCLVCHAGVGTYAKGDYGLPLEGVDLTVAAQSVGVPTRHNCGSCHFNGGGGNAVKHGDLDESLYWPSASIDVHMGEHDFQCIDCHQTEDHNIKGRSITVSLDNENQVYCTECHGDNMHADERLNTHLDTVACQTCHIPQFALEDPTKMEWKWSEAGQDIGDDPHVYLKIKGSFVYSGDVRPQYFWYNGVADRYLLGDPIVEDGVTPINYPRGDINDPTAKIMPFKVHVADQIYDTVNNYLIQPKTVGEGGYWSEFDWQLAANLGSEITGLPYSGSYGFTETIMFWPTTHMVQPISEALQCTACHSDEGRLDWQALGYPGDPIEWGSRFDNGN